MSTKTAEAAREHSALAAAERNAARLHSTSAANTTSAGTSVPADAAQLRVVPTPPRTKPVTQTGLPNAPKTPATRKPAAKPAAGKSAAAAKPAPAKGTPAKGTAAKPKPAPAPKTPPAPKIDKTAVVHTAMIRAWAELALKWDAKSTGITAEDAMKIIAHRAAYCSPKATWDSRLGPRHLNAR